MWAVDAHLCEQPRGAWLPCARRVHSCVAVDGDGMTQSELFEPTGLEVGRLAQQHAAKSAAALRLADTFRSRGWDSLSREQLRLAREHDDEAEALAMLADFERLGGVVA